MGDALLVSSKQKEQDFFQRGLTGGNFVRIYIAAGGSEARRLLLHHTFDLIVISASLVDDTGIGLAVDAAEKTDSVVILASAGIDYDRNGTEESGVFVVPWPLQETQFEQYIRLISIVNKRVTNIREENQKLQKRMQEIRIVSRAKLILIETKKMSEGEAHRFIEKQAMDNRVTRLEIANRIIEGKAV